MALRSLAVASCPFRTFYNLEGCRKVVDDKRQLLHRLGLYNFVSLLYYGCWYPFGLSLIHI